MSEICIGKILTKLFNENKLSRNEVVVSTKGGFIPDVAYIQKFINKKKGMLTIEDIATSHCMTPSFINHQLENSLKNLKLDCVDIYYLHNPEVELQKMNKKKFYERVEQIFELFEKKVSQQKICRYGIASWSGFRVKPNAKDYIDLSILIKLAEKVGGKNNHFKVLQSPYNVNMPEGFTLLNQKIKNEAVSFLEAAKHFGLYVFSSASLQQGHVFKNSPSKLEKFLPELTNAQRAIQFVRSTPHIGTALVGMRREEHVEENLSLTKTEPLNEEEFRKIFNIIFNGKYYL